MSLLPLLLLCSFAALTAAAPQQLPPPYVLYGEMAKQGQFPFAGWLLRSCTASILDSTTLLTAGHCVCRKPATTVLLGAANGWTPEEGHVVVELDTNRQYVHPEYKDCGKQGKDDLAIIKTKSPIKFTRNIQPIKLHNSPTVMGQSITVSGFGRDESHKNGRLKYATNKVAPCRNYPGCICQPMRPNMPYYGDSGGPLFVIEGGQYEQVGVVSGGDFKANQAIYGDLYPNLSWVRSYMG